MNSVINTAVVVLLLFLLFNAVYLLTFSIAGIFYKQNKYWHPKKPGRKKKFLVLLPGYKEDQVIIQSAQSVLGQDYPRHLFECVVIADSFCDSTINSLQKIGASVHIIEPHAGRNKSRAINHYLRNIDKSFDVCLILDADNCIDRDALSKAEPYFQHGVSVLQAQRVAKNENNTLARLDSLSETINNHIFRKGQRALGFSASLIGSGMFFRMQLLQQLMNGLDVYSGFDKELELRILEDRRVIEYATEIKVWDEKVSRHKDFINQRRRWINAQVFFLTGNVSDAYHHLLKHRNVDFFNKVLQFALLPRAIGLGCAILITTILPWVNPHLFPYAAAILLAMLMAVVLPVARLLSYRELFRLSFGLPIAFLAMLKAGLTSGRASGKFIHTPHNS